MARRQLVPVTTPLHTSLPSSPVDGQHIYYRFTPTTSPASTIPMLWHLMWDAAAGAWLPVNEAAPIVARFDTGQSAAMGAGSFGTFNANDPSASVPLNGTYELISAAAEAYGAAGCQVVVGFRIGGTHESGPESSGYIAAASAPSGALEVRLTKTLTVAGGQVAQDYLSTVAQTNTIRGRWVSARPLKITP